MSHICVCAAMSEYKCLIQSVSVWSCVQIVPEITAVAFSILWLSRVRAGVRRLSHTTFIYYTGRQTGGEPGAERLEWGTEKANSEQALPSLFFVVTPKRNPCFSVSRVENNQSLLWIIIKTIQVLQAVSAYSIDGIQHFLVSVLGARLPLRLFSG